MHACRKHTVKLERDKAAEKGYNFTRWANSLQKGNIVPHVQITWVEGRSPEQKRKIAAQITETLESDGRAKRENIHIAFLDVPATNYAEAGVTVADQKRTP
jgi:4-oxalocrotonate tautomerase